MHCKHPGIITATNTDALSSSKSSVSYSGKEEMSTKEGAGHRLLALLLRYVSQENQQ
jgi:hypothetical protein